MVPPLEGQVQLRIHGGVDQYSNAVRPKVMPLTFPDDLTADDVAVVIDGGLTGHSKMLQDLCKGVQSRRMVKM